MQAGVAKRRRIELVGWAAFALIGWAGLLVPSLIRSIEHDFEQSDAGIGAFYLVFAVAYAAGSVAGGVVTERIGRRRVLAGSMALHAVALAIQAVAPAWPVFLVAGIPRGLGSGAIDGGIQGLFLDAFPDAPSRALNRLHLWFSLGSLVAPIGLATLVEAGWSWQALTAASAVASLAIGLALSAIAMPSGRHDRSRESDVRVGLPLVLAGLAIAAYVAAEVGVSSWLVRFLAAAPLAIATAALTLFWAGLSVGRIVASRIGDRIEPVWLTVAASAVAALAIVGGVISPSIEASIALFTLAGFAFGPIFPAIILIGHRLYPGRPAAVTGFLAGVAVAGSIGYPPLMGAMSINAGLGVGMVGAAGLSLASGVLLVAAGARSRMTGSRRDEGAG